MNKNELILQKQTEVTVRKYYKEYIKFMNILFKMPRFQIKYRNITKDVFANVKEKDGNFILTIDSFLCKMRFAKPTLYHEFTHIYDHIIMNQLGIEQEYAYRVYTEYHASQIQMMAKLNLSTLFGSINDDIDIKIIYNELLDKKLDFTNKVQLLDLSLMEDFNKAIDWFCYYIGQVNTFLYYFSQYEDTLLELSNYQNVFGKEILLVQDALYHSDTTNITIDNIINIDNWHLVLLDKFNPK